MIELDGQIFRVVRFNIRPGSSVHIDIKEVRSGKKVTKKLKASEAMELVQLEKAPLEVQYVLGDLVFMTNRDSGESVEGPLDFFGSNQHLLVPGLEVTGFFNEGELVLVNMPNHIKAKVVGVEPDHEAGFVMATLESGGQVKLPDKVAKGATVTFRTDTGEMTGID